MRKLHNWEKENWENKLKEKRIIEELTLKEKGSSTWFEKFSAVNQIACFGNRVKGMAQQPFAKEIKQVTYGSKPQFQQWLGLEKELLRKDL